MSVEVADGGIRRGLQEFHTLVVADMRRETDEVVSVAFEVPSGLAKQYSFSPGQHLTLRQRFDDQEVRRSYSICSGVNDNELRVAIKRVPAGRFSEWVHAELQPGMGLDVMTPAGRFTIQFDPARERRYLALAVGKGITPVMSLLKSALACEPHSHFTLVYGNRVTRGILFRDQLADLKDRYLDRLQLMHVLSGQQQGVPLFNGRVDATRLRQLADTLIHLGDIDEVFLCVPRPTALALREALLELGVAASCIHFELFGPPREALPPVARSTGVEHHMTLIARGVHSEIELEPTSTVLEAGLAAGLDLPFSCKDGICATCRARVCEGEVQMAANYALEPWELERGFVLTCQARPVSSRVVIDYDQS